MPLGGGSAYGGGSPFGGRPAFGGGSPYGGAFPGQYGTYGEPLGIGGSNALGLGNYGLGGGSGLPPKIRAIFIPQGGGG